MRLPRAIVTIVTALAVCGTSAAYSASGTPVKIGGTTIIVPPQWSSSSKYVQGNVASYSFSLAGDNAFANKSCVAGHGGLAIGNTDLSVANTTASKLIASKASSAKSLNCGPFKGRYVEIISVDHVLFVWYGRDGSGRELSLSGSSSFYITAPAETDEKVKTVLADRESLKQQVLASIKSCLGASTSTKQKPKGTGGQLKASFDIEISTDQGTSWIEHAKVVLKNLDTGKEGGFEVTKQSAGMDFGVHDDPTPMRLRVVKVIILTNAVYHMPLRKTCPAGLMVPLEITGKALGKAEFAFSRKTGLQHTFRYRLPLCPVTVTVSKWDRARKQYLPARASLAISDAEKRKVFAKQSASSPAYVRDGLAEFFVPPASLVSPSTKRIRVFGLDSSQPQAQIKDAFYRPSPRVNTSVIGNLRLTDPMSRLSEWTTDIRAELRNTVGSAQATTFGGVRFITGAQPHWVKSPTVACFHQGCVWVPDKFDHTSDNSAEEMLHELGHATAWAMDVEAGGYSRPAHNQWEAAITPEVAWDEARAHVYALLYSDMLGAPCKSEYTVSTALSVSANKPSKSNPAPGNKVEGVIAAALLDYYKSQTNPRQRLTDFIATQRDAARARSNPDTAQEFFAYKIAELRKKGASASATSLDAIQKKLRIRK